MSWRTLLACSMVVLLLGGCKGFEQTNDDTGPSESGPGSVRDGTPDTGTPDTGTPDTGTPDTGTPDTGTPDTGTPDTGTPDTGTPDTGTPDTGTPDTGTPDTGTPDTGTPDATGPPPDSGPLADVGSPGSPGGPCRALVLPCLPASDPKVLEVPTELTAKDAFAQAKAGETIQLRGGGLGFGWWLPAYVTLRGCEGATVTGFVGFAGSGGTIEGMHVIGNIFVGRTGSYVIRHNRFTGTKTEPGVDASATDSLVPASIEAVIHGNLFKDRPIGVRGATSYDTGTREVALTVRDNLFVNVKRPVVLSEGGTIGNKVTARVEHNTLHGFDEGISLFNLQHKALVVATLFSQGKQAIAANGGFYELQHCMSWNVTTAYDTSPIAGSLATGDPLFVDPASGDLRLGSGSAALDRLPSSAVVPSEDYHGCPRPVGALSTTAKADIGALEAWFN